MVEIFVFAVYMHFRNVKCIYPQIFWTILSFISFLNFCYTALELVEKEHQNTVYH